MNTSSLSAAIGAIGQVFIDLTYNDPNHGVINNTIVLSREIRPLSYLTDYYEVDSNGVETTERLCGFAYSWDGRSNSINLGFYHK